MNIPESVIDDFQSDDPDKRMSAILATVKQLFQSREVEVSWHQSRPCQMVYDWFTSEATLVPGGRIEVTMTIKTK